MTKLPDPKSVRKPDHAIEELFIKRWSPRALDKNVSEAEMKRLFEAARWAPSTYNEQEWRFLFSKNGDQHWSTFMDILVPANQAWCKLAGYLVLVLSKKTFTKTGKPNPVHTFDAGLSSMNLMLQAAAMGLFAHGMAGFDRDKAKNLLKIPDDFNPEAMIAVGRPADTSVLPPELAEREVITDRKKIEEFARAGAFAF